MEEGVVYLVLLVLLVLVMIAALRAPGASVVIVTPSPPYGEDAGWAAPLILGLVGLIGTVLLVALI